VIKNYTGKSASYAKGGEVLHKSNSVFLKTPDRFRESQYKAKTEVSAPAVKEKSLPAVKPRGG
jgi:hypothetical protein